MTKDTKNSVGNSSYEKIKEAVNKVDQAFESETETTVKTNRKTEQQARPARKKTYERIIETDIPQHVLALFAKDGYALRWIRHRLDGEDDLRNLSRREREGYEFVTADELPEDFLASVRIYDGKSRQGLVTSGDTCLVKVDMELQQSRKDFYKQQTDAEVKAADVYNITKKGFRDLGSKSSVSVGKEPSFQ